MYSNMLELAISMIFLYLMLSAASSAIQEIIANMFRWRAKTLEKGIAGLLDEAFKDELYKTPLISGLCSPNARGQLTHKPSYIPPATFALAVLQVSASNPLTLANSKAAALLASLLRGTNGVDDQKKRLEDWFNGSMDRISGWYKRKAHAVLWIIAAILCIFVNADSISLANAFWNDPALRAAITTAATEKVKTPSTQKPAPANNAAPGGASASKGNSPPKSPGQTPASDASTPPSGAAASTGNNANSNQPATDDDAFKRLEGVRGELARLNIPLGWCHAPAGRSTSEIRCWPDFTRAKQSLKDKTTAGSVSGGETNTLANDPRLRLALTWNNRYWWVLKLLGIAVTALAISQGAPFWFDLLQKAVNLRLAGDAPDEKKQNK